VAAATGNVTNQAVQFQNNGAPSRQHYGSNISCNGATMTFSPFYMGNHTKPWDIDEDGMSPSSYTMAENWGAQINFMVPLDREGLNRCRSMAARQEEKMMLDYELVRVKNCAELQQKGFMLRPGSRVYNMCSDVIPIAAYKRAELHGLVTNEFLNRIKTKEATTQDLKAACDWLKANDISGVAYDGNPLDKLNQIMPKVDPDLVNRRLYGRK